MKTRLFCLFMCVAVRIHAANEVTLVPASGMPITQIMGVPAVDVRALQNGDLIAYDLYFENIDFTFAACEFQIYFPLFLLSLSGQDADWSSGTGAVFLVDPGLVGVDILALPIDANGQRVAPRGVLTDGNVRIGLVFADPLTRWHGTPSNSHPGGRLGTIRFIWQGSSSCVSRLEPVQVLLGPSFVDVRYDYFSDGEGNRVPIVTTPPISLYGLEGQSAYFGDPARRIRGDADQDDTRDATDALPAALCALNGQDQCAGGVWVGVDPAEFIQTFDFNCNGSVGASDSLGLARLGLGLRDRTVTPVETLTLQTGSGSIHIDWETHTGGLAYLSLSHAGLTLDPPRLSGPPSASPWQLIYEKTGDTTEILILNSSETTVPDLYLDFGNPSGGAQLQIMHSVIQTWDGTVSQPKPSLVAN